MNHSADFIKFVAILIKCVSDKNLQMFSVKLDRLVISLPLLPVDVLHTHTHTLFSRADEDTVPLQAIRTCGLL